MVLAGFIGGIVVGSFVTFIIMLVYMKSKEAKYKYFLHHRGGCDAD